jgi:hypothetical protein
MNLKLTSIGGLATTTGNLIVASSTNTGWTSLAVGSDGQILTASSSRPTGLAWTGSIGNLTSAYNIVNSSSRKWDAMYSLVNASSSKWDLTYSLVNASSSKWDAAYGSLWNTNRLQNIAGLSTTTGNLLVASSSLLNGWGVLGIGTSGYYLMASSGAPMGMSWQPAPATSLTGGQANYPAYWTSATALGTSSTLNVKTPTWNFIGVTTTAAYKLLSKKVEGASTITKIGCSCDSGSSTLAFFEAGIGTPYASSTSIINSIVCTTAGASSTTFADSSIADTSWITGLVLAVSSCTNTVAYVQYSVSP